MDMIIIYLIYILGLVGVIFMFLFFWTKISIFREKRGILRDIMDKGIDCKIDLERFLK